MKVEYNGNRKIVYKQGDEITDGDIQRLCYMSYKGHRPEMRQYTTQQCEQKVKTKEDLAFAYACQPSELNLLLGDDWYLVWADETRTIRALDFVRNKPQDKDLLTQQQKELSDAFDFLLSSSVSVKDGKVELVKEIATELREDTSYYLFLMKKRHGVVEQIYEETVRSWYNDLDKVFTEEDQQEFLKSARERRNHVDSDGVKMHTVWFKSSKKTIDKILERRKQLEGNEELV